MDFAPDPRDRTFVYRLYDSAGTLLYVGESKNPQARINTHRNRYWDWPGQVTSWAIEEYPTRQRAWQEEREAIRKEQPLHNLQRYNGLSVAPRERRVAWPEVQLEIFFRWKSGTTTLQESMEQLIATGLDPARAARKLGVTPGTTLERVLERNQSRLLGSCYV